MDFFDVLNQRHSIRAYKSQPVAPEALQRILDAMNRAPSAGNIQAYEVYMVSDAQRKASLVQAAYEQDFLAQAPIVLVFCAHAARSADRYGMRGTGLYCLQDAAIACTFAMLAAAALGLATVWVGSFDEDAVRGVIGAPQAHRPVAMLPLGYAAESAGLSSRRSLDNLVHQVR